MGEGIWAIGTAILGAFSSGFSVLMEPPVSYFLVFGFIMSGLAFARKVMRRRG